VYFPTVTELTPATLSRTPTSFALDPSVRPPSRNMLCIVLILIQFYAEGLKAVEKLQ